ncbi:hypothetical protein AK812_SmicGene34697 [Symbiodinium microadriaticum]|uniref:TPM domain-containing protein n=1 Tax=Symbiodinium microadriaticum TaxID=2951 RepID=A0A1Q9CNC1_SYMMI|nr:hypothetical protein AK812_SmicGene34697 [Symbiodinium microadriaticum]
MIRAWAALSQSCRLLCFASAAFAAQTSGCQEISKRSIDTPLRRELEKLLPSDKMQYKAQLEKAFKQLDAEVFFLIDEPELTMWRAKLGSVGERLAILIILQHGQVLKFKTGFKKPSGFAKASAILFVNKWNERKNFGRAYLDADGDAALEMDVDLDWISDRPIEHVKECFRLFTSLALVFLLEFSKGALTDDSGTGEPALSFINRKFPSE